MSNNAKHPTLRILSASELDAVAGGVYVNPKKPKPPIIIIDFPLPPPPVTM